MAVILLLLLLLLHVTLPLSREVTHCDFPDFLDSHSSAEDVTARRDWRTHWRQHVLYHQDDIESSSASSSSARVYFDHGVMRFEEATRRRLHEKSNKTQHSLHGHDQRHGHRRSRLSFTRQCQQIVVGDDGQPRYLVAHRQVGQSETNFICTEFVRRSNAIVQV